MVDVYQETLADIEREKRQGGRVEYGRNLHHGELYRAAKSAILTIGGVREDKPHPAADEFQGSDIPKILCRVMSAYAGRNITKTELLRYSLDDSSKFPRLMSDIVNVAVQDGWKTSDKGWERFTSKKILPNFQAGMFPGADSGVLQKYGENTEISQETIGDAGEKGKVESFGRIFGVTRQVLITGDSQWIEAAVDAGRAANRTIGQEIVTYLESNPALVDGVALFHTTHGNQTTTAGAPSVNTLAEVYEAMGNQTDLSTPNPTKMNLRPASLLVPAAESPAAQTLRAALWPPGEIAGEDPGLTIISDSRLDGNSWYSFANPEYGPGLSVISIGGNLTPIVRMLDARDSDGWQDGDYWRVTLDFGIAALDHRSMTRTAMA